MILISVWWLTYPSEKYEFVSWDDELPNIWKNKSHVPNHQPAIINLWDIPIPVTGEDSDRYPDVKAAAAGGILLVSPLESPTCAVHPVPWHLAILQLPGIDLLPKNAMWLNRSQCATQPKKHGSDHNWNFTSKNEDLSTARRHWQLLRMMTYYDPSRH